MNQPNKKRKTHENLPLQKSLAHVYPALPFSYVGEPEKKKKKKKKGKITAYIYIISAS